MIFFSNTEKWSKEEAGVQLACCFAVIKLLSLPSSFMHLTPFPWEGDVIVFGCDFRYFFHVMFAPLCCAFCCLSLHLLKDFPRGKNIKLVSVARFGIFFKIFFVLFCLVLVVLST